MSSVPSASQPITLGADAPGVGESGNDRPNTPAELNRETRPPSGSIAAIVSPANSAIDQSVVNSPGPSPGRPKVRRGRRHRRRRGSPVHACPPRRCARSTAGWHARWRRRVRTRAILLRLVRFSRDGGRWQGPIPRREASAGFSAIRTPALSRTTAVCEELSPGAQPERRIDAVANGRTRRVMLAPADVVGVSASRPTVYPIGRNRTPRHPLDVQRVGGDAVEQRLARPRGHRRGAARRGQR